MNWRLVQCGIGDSILLKVLRCFNCVFSSDRVTGKMVGTASVESVQAGTKLLDIPLSPDNNMTVL